MSGPKEEIPVMEKALAERGFSVAQLCRRADIAAISWIRWRDGLTSPTFEKWAGVRSAYDALMATEAQP